jgi:hypothetical protein
LYERIAITNRDRFGLVVWCDQSLSGRSSGLILPSIAFPDRTTVVKKDIEAFLELQIEFLSQLPAYGL